MRFNRRGLSSGSTSLEVPAKTARNGEKHEQIDKALKASESWFPKLFNIAK